MDLKNIDRSGWETYRFDQIAQNIRETVEPSETELEVYVGLEHLDPESIRIKRHGVPSDVKGTKLRAYPGDVIFGRRRAYQRKASVIETDCICSAHSMILRANPEVILPELLPFFLHSDTFMHRAIDISVGSLSPTINWGTLKKQEFLLPPKPQQARLAELLWAAQEVVEGYIYLEKVTQKLKLSTFKKFCKKYSNSSFHPVKSLLFDGPTNGYSPKANTEQKGSRTVSIGAIQDGQFSPEGHLKYADVEDSILERFNVKTGDVFVVRGNGNRNLCGKAGLAKEDYSNLFYPDLLIRLRFDEEKVLPEFAAYQWNYPLTHHQLLRWAKSTNGIWKVNGNDIKQHKLMVPPLEDQKSIVEVLHTISNSLDQIIGHREKTAALQKSLINQIF